MEPDDFEPAPTLKPWPLCFSLFGLLLIVAIAYALLISLAGCTQTTVTSKALTLKTQANIKKMTVSADGSWSIEGLNHSTPTLAGGKAVSNGAQTFFSGATGLATGLFVHGL